MHHEYRHIASFYIISSIIKRIHTLFFKGAKLWPFQKSDTEMNA